MANVSGTTYGHPFDNLKQYFKNMGHPRSRFGYFLSFQNNFYRKIVDSRTIRTQIVGVEGGHTDHFTTAPILNNITPYRFLANKTFFSPLKLLKASLSTIEAA